MNYYLLACGALLAVGLVLNITDRRMLLLTVVVGAGFFWPPPAQSAAAFYSFCIAVEIAVGLVALRIDRQSGVWVADIALLLVLAHIMGFVLDGHPPFSPYRVIVKILEVSQIAVCVVLSPVLMPILRNRDATIT